MDIDHDKTDDDVRLYYTYKFYFHNIQNQLTAEQLKSFASLDGAEDVDIAYYDDPDTFQGVLLKVSCYYEPGLKVKIDLPDAEVHRQKKGMEGLGFTLSTK